MANLGYIQVTRACNQRCLFCSNPPIAKEQTWENVRTQIDDLADRGYDGVIFTGGEPTLAPFLGRAIRYATERGLHARIISNGQLLASRQFVERLVRSGLDHVHLSVHSHRREVQAALTRNPASLDNIRAALENLGALNVQVDVNSVICAQNADHLHENVAWILRDYPFVRHFVWNNLDPHTDRCRENPEVLCRLPDFEYSLHLAMRLVVRSGRTFRVERVPLCYMAEFAEFSTETRKIVKGEERIVHFLDDAKGTVRQTEWEHAKASVCRFCRFDPICAGVFAPEVYGTEALSPVFLSPDRVRRAILGEPGRDAASEG